MGSLPVWKGATMTTIQIQNNQWSLEHCLVLRIIHFAAPFAQKCDHLPPPPHHPYISETAFSHRFQKVYTTPPPPQRGPSSASSHAPVPDLPFFRWGPVRRSVQLSD